MARRKGQESVVRSFLRAFPQGAARRVLRDDLGQTERAEATSLRDDVPALGESLWATIGQPDIAYLREMTRSIERVP